MTRRLGQALALVSLLAAPAASAQTSISTEADAPGTQISWSPPTAGFTIGQTFRAPDPANVFLQSFRISLQTQFAAPYTARLWEWDAVNTRVTGPALFSETRLASPTSVEYLTFAVDRSLSFTSQYLFAVSVATGSGWGGLYSTNTNPYAGGDLWHIWTDDAALMQTEPVYPWINDAPLDAGFTATFASDGSALTETTATPEPASMALLGTGLAGLAGAARRRRTPKKTA